MAGGRTRQSRSRSWPKSGHGGRNVLPDYSVLQEGLFTDVGRPWLEPLGWPARGQSVETENRLPKPGPGDTSETTALGVAWAPAQRGELANNSPVRIKRGDRKGVLCVTPGSSKGTVATGLLRPGSEAKAWLLPEPGTAAAVCRDARPGPANADHRPATSAALCCWAWPSLPHSGSRSTVTSSLCSLRRA